jgi:hypothetical protein
VLHWEEILERCIAFFLVSHVRSLLGKLPTSIARLITLKHLFLSNNYLSGTIPKALGDAALSLESIYLRGNILTGTIPESLEDLRDLTILFIDGTFRPDFFSLDRMSHV